MRIDHGNKMLWYVALSFALVIACAFSTTSAQAQSTWPSVDCTKIDAAKLMSMDNMLAGHILVQCGYMRGGQPAYTGTKVPGPSNVRTSNRSCTSSSSCTKSEDMIAGSTKDNGKTLVSNYNDDYGCCSSGISGTSYSTDGGNTFHEIIPPPFNSGHGFNDGDPIVVFNSKLGKFFAGDLAAGCGGQGVGLWTSSDGKTWTTGACAHNVTFDDRESMWADNEPTSGTYGRMYVSYNDYSVVCGVGGCPFVTYSDDGNTWSTPVELNNTIFIRNIQVTGSPRGAKLVGKNSTVFVAGMDEGGGGNAQRQNYMYNSTDGGKTWTQVKVGTPYNPVGDQSCGYFYQVNPIWRHMGWGEPGVGPNGVVHYVYAGAGTNGDHGDIFYTCSKDNGKTWSKPIKLNTDKDAPNKTQWMPSLSVTKTGQVTASWYDRRKATSACNNVGDPGCNYERVARQSKDNGVTWGAEITVSSAVIPQPAQDDPSLVSCYAGDYDYDVTLGKNGFVTWTDGRRKVGGVNVQDVDFAKVPEP